MNSALATHQLSVLVERLLELPQERWQATLTEANVSPEVSAEVLAILNAVSGSLQQYVPSAASLAETPLRPGLDGWQSAGRITREGVLILEQAARDGLHIGRLRDDQYG